MNKEKVINQIVAWIKNYAEQAGINNLIFELSDDVNSTLTALLCQKTRLNILGIVFNSEGNNKFAESYNIKYYNHDNEIDYEAMQGLTVEDYPDKLPKTDVVADQGDLNSAFLSILARNNKALIIGSVNKNNYNLVRNYPKHNCFDLLPIADLYLSQITELFTYLTTQRIGFAAGAIVEAPLKSATAILNQPKTLINGLTPEEIEWADKENNKHNIISQEKDPVTNPAWLLYTGSQKAMLAKIYQMEKLTRHKINPNLPVCKICQ